MQLVIAAAAATNDDAAADDENDEALLNHHLSPDWTGTFSLFMGHKRSSVYFVEIQS